MAMTKQDFEAIAHCFTPFSEHGERGTDRDKPLRLIGSPVAIVALLIPVFLDINPRFDMNKFLYACGFGAEEIEEIHEAMGLEEEVY